MNDIIINNNSSEEIWNFVYLYGHNSRVILNPLGADLDTKSLPAGPGVVVFTSGTTGVPKPVLVDPKPLVDNVKGMWDRFISGCEAGSLYIKDSPIDRTWLNCYNPKSFAGLSVASNAYFGAVYDKRESPKETVSKIVFQKNVDYVCGTPSYLRAMINSWPENASDMAEIRVKKVVLGGEPVDQQTIDLIKEYFNPEEVIHFYASTENGIMARSLKGSELALYKNNENITIDSSGQVLFKGVPTGDFGAAFDDGFAVCGRVGDVVNVGGVKLSKNLIEGKIRSISGVRECLVHTVNSRLVGSIPVAVVDTDLSAKDIYAVLNEYPGWPTISVKIREVDLNSNGKAV